MLILQVIAYLNVHQQHMDKTLQQHVKEHALLDMLMISYVWQYVQMENMDKIISVRIAVQEVEPHRMCLTFV
jgi:hypothetical protein